MSFGIPPNQPTSMMNGVGPNQNFGGGHPTSSALLPTPPSLQMPVPMPAVPPPLMPGMIPVAMIGSAAPVPFIATSASPLLAGNNLATFTSQSPAGTSIKQNYRKTQRHSDSQSNSQEGSTTTVFVGNITEHASDSLVRQILMKCGPVSSWKRVQGASGRLQAFGFCEYGTPEAALRCMRIMNSFKLGDKTLLVKVDSKTRAQLDDYKKKMKEEHADDDADNLEYDVELDETTKSMDKECLDVIADLISGNSAVLTGTYDESLPYMKRSHSGCADNLEGLDMDNAKKDLVSKEIRSFRQAYRNEDDASKKDKDREGREKDRDRDKDRERDRRREREDRDRDKDFDRRRDSRRRRDEDNHSDEETKRNSRKGTRESEPTDRLRRSRSRSRDKDKNKEDEEDDEYERRRLERVKRDKEKTYMERLKEFEARERKKMREYEKQFSKDLKRKEEEAEERVHLKEFLEDYDDDRDDVKYYRSSALSRRMRDREMEAESDHRDKQREMEEIDEILRKRLADPSFEKENESPLQNRIKLEKTPEKVYYQQQQQQQQPLMKPTFSVVKNEQRSPSPEPMPSMDNSSAKNSPLITNFKREKEPEEEVEQPSKKKTIGFGLKATTVQSSKKLDSVFTSKDEDLQNEDSPKKKLSKIETKEEEEKKKAASANEKKKTIRNLIEKIPTAKDELFQFPIKMDMIDQNLVDKRIKPWVNKKIFEYIGEQEPTLVEFICSKVIAKSMPKNILEDVEMVLDEEAEVFVVKMWRLLIYETEAKHLGLVK